MAGIDGTFFQQASRSVGMRRLAAARVSSVLADTFPELRFQVQLSQGRIVVLVRARRRWWLALQLPRLVVWLRVRRVLWQVVLDEVKATVEGLEVGFF